MSTVSLTNNQADNGDIHMYNTTYNSQHIGRVSNFLKVLLLN